MNDGSTAPVTVQSSVPSAFTFTPTGPGAISFSFIESTAGDTNPVRLKGVAVVCVDAVDDYASVSAGGQSVVVSALSNDVNLPADGTVTMTRSGGSAAGAVSIDSATGKVTYTPVAAETGRVVTIGYKACSSDDLCDFAIIHIPVGKGISTSTTSPAGPKVLPETGSSGRGGTLLVGAVAFALGAVLLRAARRSPRTV